MPVTDNEVAALRALLKGDVERHNELFAEFASDQDPVGYMVLLTAAFGRAVQRRFGESHTPWDITEFVTETRQWAEHPSTRIDQEAGERAIGAVLGEATTQGLDEGAQFDAQFQLLIALVAAERLDDAGLDAFMADARELANQMIEASDGSS